MSTLQQFHRFGDLARELQLHIWECYERAQPHRRHYFRSMMVWPGRLYAGADQHTSLRISSTASADDPGQTRVPDAAVAPKTKIQLPGSGDADQNWVSQHAFPDATSFSSVQLPRSMASPAYIWVNFRNDTFCFAQNGDGNNGGAANFLQYFQGASGLFSVTSGSQSPVMSHWFFRIQRLVFIKSAASQALGPFDRQVLGFNPSLRRLTIVTVSDAFRCSHLHRLPQKRSDTPSTTDRHPLTTFLALRQEFMRSCACDHPVKWLDEQS